MFAPLQPGPTYLEDDEAQERIVPGTSSKDAGQSGGGPEERRVSRWERESPVAEMRAVWVMMVLGAVGTHLGTAGRAGH